MTAILPRSDTSTTQLTGGRLIFARVLWTAVTVYSLALVVAMVVAFYQTETTSSVFAGALAELNMSARVLALVHLGLGILQSLAFSGIAIFLFLHKPNDAITIFASLTLITFGNFGGSFLALNDSTMHGPLSPFVSPAVGLSNGLFVAFLYCMPDGKFVPRWVGPPVIIWSIWSFVTGFFPDSIISPFSWPNSVSFLFFLIAYVASVPVQRYRMKHHNSAAQNQQIKWIVLALVIALVAGYVLPFWPPLMFPELSQTGVPGLIFFMVSRLIGTLAVITFPLLLSFSVRRYRLWEVDAVLHRGVVYGFLTAFLILLFAGTVLMVQLVARHFSGGMQSGIGLLVSGAIFGAMFNPARRWLRTQVDRRMFGINVDYHTPARAGRAAAPASGGMGRIEGGTQLGVYEVLEPIGRGGMAEVYKGQHTSLGRTVAIKVLPPELATQPDFRKRFEREAHLNASLKHPNIVQLFDFGEADGTYYMVMEFLPGQTLSGMLRDRGPLEVDEGKSILADVGSALDYAHQQGIVHRDVKPSNVMMQPDTNPGGKAAQRAILTDFGIARLATGGTRITSTGVVGTFDYIAPEQIRDARDVDARADIYSLGVMGFQVFTGRLPFTASNPGALLIAHLQQPAPDPREFRPDLPEEVCDTLLKALEKDPDHRFGTAGELTRALSL